MTINHRNVGVLMAELAIIAVVSALGGFVWTNLPDGGESGWIFAAMLVFSVGYIYFVYDDHPKIDVRKDIPLLIVSFVIEAVVLAVTALVWWVAFSGLFAVASFIRQNSLLMRLGPKTFLELLLMFWGAANMFLWQTIQKPKEAEYRDRELP